MKVGRETEASHRHSICHRVTTLSHNARGADYEASPPGKSAAGAAAVTIFGGPSHSGHSVSPYHRHLAAKTAPSPRQSRHTFFPYILEMRVPGREPQDTLTPCGLLLWAE